MSKGTLVIIETRRVLPHLACCLLLAIEPTLSCQGCAKLVLQLDPGGTAGALYDKMHNNCTDVAW